MIPPQDHSVCSLKRTFCFLGFFRTLVVEIMHVGCMTSSKFLVLEKNRSMRRNCDCAAYCCIKTTYNLADQSRSCISGMLLVCFVYMSIIIGRHRWLEGDDFESQ